MFSNVQHTRVHAQRPRMDTGSSGGGKPASRQPAGILFVVDTFMHAVLASSSVPLFLGALLSDWAYANSYQLQWANFASWLIAGGLVIIGLAMLWGLIDLLRSPATRPRRGWLYLGLLLSTFVVGFVNALIHAKDGWAVMPTALILSAVVLVLVVASSAVGLKGTFWRAA